MIVDQVGLFPFRLCQRPGCSHAVDGEPGGFDGANGRDAVVVFLCVAHCHYACIGKELLGVGGQICYPVIPDEMVRMVFRAGQRWLREGWQPLCQLCRSQQVERPRTEMKTVLSCRNDADALSALRERYAGGQSAQSATNDNYIVFHFASPFAFMNWLIP